MTDLLRDNIEYCKISTRFEDLLAERPILNARNREDLDTEFAKWLQKTEIHNGVQVNPEAPGVVVARNIMRWRGLLSRVYIHRPLLLWFAMRKSSLARLSQDKQHAVITCRSTANQLINDIQASWHNPSPCQMAGWCATWQLYQAAMVPLLSLFCDADDQSTYQESKLHVETALSALTELEKWSPTAKRSYEVVLRIYEAGCAFLLRKSPIPSMNMFESSAAPLDTPSTTDSATMYDGFFMHDFFGDLSWYSDQAPVVPNTDLELSFLDYWDIGQEANRAI